MSTVNTATVENMDSSLLLSLKNDHKLDTQLARDDNSDSDHAIDKFWIWPKEARPTVQHDHFDMELPVIDLAPSVHLKSLREEAAQLDGTSARKTDIEAQIRTCEAATVEVRNQMRRACEEYGFFQVVNHGMSMDVIERYRKSCTDLFEFPDEVRKKAELENPKNMKPFSSGFQSIHRSSPINRTGSSHFWNEAFDYEAPEKYYPGRLDEIVNTLWPENAPEREKGLQFRSNANEYGQHMGKLTMHLLELLAASLGLHSAEPFIGHTSEAEVEGRLRINHYPVCAQPELTWGVHSHTDPTVLTILYQGGDVAGLQIGLRDGTWHGVRPIPGAFVVNVGDYLQATSNGRFVSAQHQAVANDKDERYTLVYFSVCPKEFVLQPALELVDDQHPLRYRPFDRADYRKCMLRHGLNSKTKNLLDAVFGIDSEVLEVG